MSNGPHNRKIFIINPEFQLKFSFFVVFIVFLSSIIFPLLIFDIFDNFTMLAQKFAPEKVAEITEKKNAFLGTIVLWETGFLFLIFVSCIFLTHKIAGPMYKLKKFLSGVREGRENGKIFFRKGDYFVDVADEINLTLEHLNKSGDSQKCPIEEMKKQVLILKENVEATEEVTAKIQELERTLDELEKL